MSAWIPDVVPDEPIESAWGNTIRDRTVTAFANVAARTAAIPAPVVGMVSWLVDVSRLEIYTGTAWVGIAPGWVTIAEVVLAATGPITFASIPATYRHLKLTGAVRSVGAGNAVGAGFRLNNDSGLNYDWVMGWSDAATGGAPAGTNVNADNNAAITTKLAATNATAGVFNPIEIEIPNYRGATHKSYMARSGTANAGLFGIYAFASGRWTNVAAVNRIDLWDRTAGANSWAAGSLVSLMAHL